MRDLDRVDPRKFIQLGGAASLVTAAGYIDDENGVDSEEKRLAFNQVYSESESSESPDSAEGRMNPYPPSEPSSSSPV